MRTIINNTKQIPQKTKAYILSSFHVLSSGKYIFASLYKKGSSPIPPVSSDLSAVVGCKKQTRTP